MHSLAFPTPTHLTKQRTKIEIKMSIDYYCDIAQWFWMDFRITFCIHHALQGNPNGFQLAVCVRHTGDTNVVLNEADVVLCFGR